MLGLVSHPIALLCKTQANLHLKITGAKSRSRAVWTL